MADQSDRPPPFSSPQEPFVLATGSTKVLFLVYYAAVIVVIAAIGHRVVAQPDCGNDGDPAASCHQDGGVEVAETADAFRSEGAGGNLHDAKSSGGPAGAPGARGMAGTDGPSATPASGVGASRSNATVGARASDQERTRRYTDGQMLMLVLIFGALGGTLHGLSSAAAHAGKGRLYSNWTVFYLVRPWVGAGMAIVVYLVVRGGLAGVAFDNDRRSEFAALGWAAMAGLFSAPAMQKLRDVFEVLFRPNNGGPPASPNPAPKSGPAIGGANTPDVQPTTAALAPAPPTPKPENKGTGP